MIDSRIKMRMSTIVVVGVPDIIVKNRTFNENINNLCRNFCVVLGLNFDADNFCPEIKDCRA